MLSYSKFGASKTNNTAIKEIITKKENEVNLIKSIMYFQSIIVNNNKGDNFERNYMEWLY